MIDLLVAFLLGSGALASGFFVGFYLRYADLRNPIARQVLALNASIAVVLIVAFLRNTGIIPAGESLGLYVQMVMFVVINLALVYQSVLLFRVKKEDKQGDGFS